MLWCQCIVDADESSISGWPNVALIVLIDKYLYHKLFKSYLRGINRRHDCSSYLITFLSTVAVLLAQSTCRVRDGDRGGEGWPVKFVKLVKHRCVSRQVRQGLLPTRPLT